jgi:hypothetical protein
VDKIIIGKDRQIKAVFRLNILTLIGQPEDFSEVPRVGTYTRIYDSVHGRWVKVIF